jgi:hypothetical protein
MGDIDARNRPSSGKCDMVDVDVPEKWGSPEFHKRQLVRQQEEQQRREVQDPQENFDAWNDWADTRIAAALDRFSAEYSDAVVELMFGRMDKKTAAETEINQLKAEVAELRGEMNLLRELLKGNVKDIGPAIRKYVA